MSDPQFDSYFRNCYVHAREGDEVLIEAHTDTAGATVYRMRMDGYAIIPMEVYEGLSPKEPPCNPPTLPAST